MRRDARPTSIPCNDIDLMRSRRGQVPAAASALISLYNYPKMKGGKAMFDYTIQVKSDIPIYRQLADQINAEIRSGALKTGTQLPTVREMAERLNLSCGTVKRVYDRLQEMGDIEMTRRRGTFVKYVREDTDSRKIKAMAAIDRMVRQLTDLNFSPAEIHIFVSLKMREWGLKWSGIHIALVTEYVDLSEYMREQLNQFSNVSIAFWPLRQVLDYPYSVDEQSDVILASPTDAQRLQTLLPDTSKLVRVAFSAEARSIGLLAGTAGKRLGAVCRDESFARLLNGFLPETQRGSLQICHIGEAATYDDFFASVNAVIVADGYAETCADELRIPLKDFQQQGRLIRFRYGIDEGSLIYLEERINQIRGERQMRPGAYAFESSDVKL